MKHGIRILAIIGLLLLVVFMAGLFASRDSDPSNPLQQRIRHHLLADEVEREPTTVHVRRHVVFDEPATKGEVDAIMRAERTGAIEQYPDVTNLGVYGFASDENARDGMGTWIAMSFTTAPFGDANLQFDDSRFDAAWQAPLVRFGLSEEKRRALFKELVIQEDRANAEADRRHPGKTKADMIARAKDAQELRKRFTEELARARGIPVDTLQAIGSEALAKGWAFPN